MQGADRLAYEWKCIPVRRTALYLEIHVGFAPLEPAEFVVIRLQQMAGRIAT